VFLGGLRPPKNTPLPPNYCEVTKYRYIFNNPADQDHGVVLIILLFIVKMAWENIVLLYGLLSQNSIHFSSNFGINFKILPKWGNFSIIWGKRGVLGGLRPDY
jgi:hypothetical protein